MDFLTREVFDTLIIVVVIIGGALALLRLYRDFTRPLPPSPDDLDYAQQQEQAEEDTKPNKTVKP